MTAVLISSDNTLNRIAGVLKLASKSGDKAVTLIADKDIYFEIFNTLKEAPHVDQMIISGVTYFLIKEFRVELKKVDTYV